MATDNAKLSEQIRDVLGDAKEEFTGILRKGYDEWVNEMTPIILAYAQAASVGDTEAENRLKWLRAQARLRASRLVVVADKSVSDKLSAIAVVLAKCVVKVINPL